MKKLLILLSGLLLLQTSCSHTESAPGTRAERVVSEIHNPASKKVLVACHRGDWRNWPENSLAAIESVIGMGADIVEIDLALTSDSVLVVCHDRTLNRTTTGKGLIAEIRYDSIQRCFLKSGHGVATSHRMPTLREALELCKDRIVVNIDKGYQYYDLVQRLSEELGVTGQLLIKGSCHTIFYQCDLAFFRCHHDIDLEWIKLCARISHCTQNSSPVCVFSKDCTFRQVGSDDRLCKHLCCLLILRVFHLHLEQTACPLSVTGDLLCKISIDCEQCLLECLVIFVLLGNLRVTCHTICHH